MKVARQRRAIVDGLRDSVEEFQQTGGLKSKDVLELVLCTQSRARAAGSAPGRAWGVLGALRGSAERSWTACATAWRSSSRRAG